MLAEAARVRPNVWCTTRGKDSCPPDRRHRSPCACARVGAVAHTATPAAGGIAKATVPGRRGRGRPPRAQSARRHWRGRWPRCRRPASETPRSPVRLCAQASTTQPVGLYHRLAALVPCARRHALGCSRDTACDRRLRGDQFSAVSVGDGSTAGLRETNLDGVDRSVELTTIQLIDV
jgi:hypothetical protein